MSTTKSGKTPPAGGRRRRSATAADKSEAALTTALTAALTTALEHPAVTGKSDPRGTNRDAVVADAVAASENASALRSGFRSLRHRNTLALRPWQIALGVFVVAAVAWLLGLGLQHPVLIGVVTPVLGLAVGGGVAWFGRQKLTAWLPAGWTPWLIGAVVDAAVWVGIVAAEGFTLLRFAWWLISAVTFGARWWAQVRLAYPDGPNAPRQLDDPTAAARLIEYFGARLGCRGGPLEGARLTDVKPYQHGLTGIIRLVPGKQSLATVMSVKPRISTALDYYDDEIVIEHNRDRKPSELDIQVVTKSPIKTTVYFDLPVFTSGRILLGPYADGIGNAVFVLYTEDSMESGYILGSKGSGKSRVIECIALTAMACSDTVIVYLDGQSGASSHLLWDHALWRGGPEQSDDILKALLRIKDYRQLENRWLKLTGFTPLPDRPGILIIVDESHDIFSRHPGLWAKLAREGRKVGIGVLGASQVATLDAFGGSGGDALRSSLISSNGIAMRTLSGVQEQVFPGLKVDLQNLPKLPGYGYTANESDDDTTRTAPFRNRHLIDDRRAAELIAGPGLPDGIRTAEDWFAHLPAQELDQGAALAAGDIYLNRHEIAEEEDADLSALFSGDRASIAEALQAMFAKHAEDNPGDEATPTAFGVTEFVSFAPAVSVPPAQNAAAGVIAPSWPVGLSPAQEAAYTAVAGGADSPTSVAQATGVSRQAAHKTLDKLTAAGHLINTGGRYTPAR